MSVQMERRIAALEVASGGGADVRVLVVKCARMTPMVRPVWVGKVAEQKYRQHDDETEEAFLSRLEEVARLAPVAPNCSPLAVCWTEEAEPVNSQY